MIIHLRTTCAAFDYQMKLQVADYKSDPKSKGACIVVCVKSKELIVPLDNILCIE